MQPPGAWRLNIDMIDVPAREMPREPLPEGPDARVFDRWLREDLRRRFGKAAPEPIPDDLMRILTAH
jgi:hypothetical protein